MRAERVLFPLVRVMAERPRLARLLFGRDPWGNPLSDEAIADPYAFTDRMLPDGPVVYRRLYQQWFVHGYDELREALADASLSNADQIETLLDVHPYTRLSDRTRFVLAHLLPVTDPPVHTRLRSLVNRAFTPRRVAGLEPDVERLASELLDALPDHGPLDLHQGFTVPLPVDVVSQLLGVPAEHWPDVRRWTDQVVKLVDPLVRFEPAEVDEAIDGLHRLYRDLADHRRRHPADDLLTGLTQAQEADGDRLSNDELATMVITLMGAGIETTAGILSASIVHLAANPDQRQLIRDHPDLWPNAVEELLRYDTPIKSVARRTLEPVEIGGVPIPAGSNLILSFVNAHRDPRRYDDPHALRLDRDQPRPLAFGHGIHHCIGAALARLETRVGLRVLLDRYPDYTVEAIDWRRSLNLRSATRLVIRP